MRAASIAAGALFGIVVDEEVLGLDHLPVEVVVLDLVLPEVLLRLAAAAPSASVADERDSARARHARAHHLSAPCASTATTSASLHRRSSW